MSLQGKIVREIEINTPPHRFYKLFKEEIFDIPKACPKLIQKVNIHGSDWSKHSHGSIKSWHYTIDDKAEVFKERVEFDDKNLVIKLVGLEGDLFDHFKTFNEIYQVVKKGPGHCAIILTLEYEKLHDGPPCPEKYYDAMIDLVKGIESHLKK
ncbi:MLP-like protein 328 [Benincasa hispida]|uniref:MLP-like protein 328 n=1 Tax=Benincasa hispida TaxID=102211 RepID=UPI0018FFEB6D|nr:MLP-like protein 328 [Benincasa hispida]